MRDLPILLCIRYIGTANSAKGILTDAPQAPHLTTTHAFAFQIRNSLQINNLIFLFLDFGIANFASQKNSFGE
jgi:hypothetical protein